MRQIHAATSTFLTLAILITAGCGDGDSHASHTEPPAKIIELNKESQIATLQLTEDAHKRLAIKTVEAKEVELARRRSVGGELLVPPGQTVTVVAPIAGTVTAPKDAQPVLAGSTVEKNQVVFDFKPLSAERNVLTPADNIAMASAKALLATSQIEAAREVESARLRMVAAKIAYNRAEQLLRDEAGSQRTVDETKAQYEISQQAHGTAEERNEFLSGITLDVDAGDYTNREITASVGGVVQNLAVAPGETVAAGDPLFDVANLNRLWVRVPLYVGYRHEVDTELEAEVTELGQTSKSTPLRAKPIVAPRIADPNASSVDLYYEIDNADGWLYPGQRVMTSISMQSKEKSLIVPWKAVLFDIHGFAWVYVETGEYRFERRRIDIKYIGAHDGEDRAVLAAGPETGSRVVTDGAAELFGREFYYIIKPGTSAH